MDGTNPTRHVLVALMVTAIVLIIAGDKWSPVVGSLGAVRPIRKGETTA